MLLPIILCAACLTGFGVLLFFIFLIFAVFLPLELIDTREALLAYTEGSAYAMGLESVTGSLLVNNPAPFLVYPFLLAFLMIFPST